MEAPTITTTITTPTTINATRRTASIELSPKEKVAITYDPLSLDDAIRDVASDEAGAISTFLGISALNMSHGSTTSR